MAKKITKETAEAKVNEIAQEISEAATEAAKKAEEAKDVVVENAQKAVKAAEKKAPKATKATKEAAKKTTEAAKKAATKAKKAVKDIAPVQETYVEINGYQLLTETIVEKVKEAYKAEGHRVSSIRSLKTYINLNEGKAYYIINDKEEGKYVEL